MTLLGKELINTTAKLEFSEQLVSMRNPENLGQILDKQFLKAEQYFFNLFEIGILEAYQFLFQECQNANHLEKWIVSLKGDRFFLEKTNEFNSWLRADYLEKETEIEEVLSTEQLQFWKEQGYLILKGIIPTQDCEDVTFHICQELGVDLADPLSWYPIHDKFQGLMVQLYQGVEIEKIRKNPLVEKIFAQLYQTKQLIPNAEKVSFNPPENFGFTFRGSSLHWDIDFDQGPRYYIQGLVYLNEVPKERGAFCLVPGYHQKINKDLNVTNASEAMERIKREEIISYLEGATGDLILWLESIPHAASPNTSNFPRFVQYVSYSKVEIH